VKEENKKPLKELIHQLSFLHATIAVVFSVLIVTTGQYTYMPYLSGMKIQHHQENMCNKYRN
jgi:hypothetical protein